MYNNLTLITGHSVAKNGGNSRHNYQTFLKRKMANEYFVCNQELEYKTVKNIELEDLKCCESFEIVHIGLNSFSILNKLPGIELINPVQIDFGGKDCFGGVYCSLGIHMGKLVDSYIHVYGRFALTVFDSESWNSVAQYFFSKTSGLEVSSMRVGEDHWRELTTEDSMNDMLESMSQMGCPAKATFFELSVNSFLKLPRGYAYIVIVSF